MQELESLLEKRLQTSAKGSAVTEAQTVTVAASNVFNGNKVFSPKKLEAMIEYISSKGYNIYKTNLNKLLFYADLTSYYLRRAGCPARSTTIAPTVRSRTRLRRSSTT
jgi:hypothetical protein